MNNFHHSYFHILVAALVRITEYPIRKSGAKITF